MLHREIERNRKNLTSNAKHALSSSWLGARQKFHDNDGWVSTHDQLYNDLLPTYDARMA